MEEKGYKVFTIENGKEGIQLAFETIPDLIISEITLLKFDKNKLKKESIADKKHKRVNEETLNNIPKEIKTPLLSVINFADSISYEFKNYLRYDILKMLDSLNSSSKELNKNLKQYRLRSELKSLLLNKNNEILKPNIPAHSSIINNVINKKIKLERNEIKLRIAESSIMISQEHLSFIVEELLTNAVKFSSKSSEIKVRGIVENNVYSLAVKNKGFGMRQEQIKSISTYTQYSRNFLQQKEKGLGLIIIKKIAELYNGSIKIYSQLHHDTMVKVLLPVP